MYSILLTVGPHRRHDGRRDTTLHLKEGGPSVERNKTKTENGKAKAKKGKKRTCTLRTVCGTDGARSELKSALRKYMRRVRGLSSTLCSSDLIESGRQRQQSRRMPHDASHHFTPC